MLNFREELSKIKKEKLEQRACFEKEADKFLMNLLDYFKRKNFSDIEDPVTVCFKVSGTELSMSTKTETYEEFEIATTHFSTSQQPEQILICLEERFEKEGYKILKRGTAKKNLYFYVDIQP